MTELKHQSSFPKDPIDRAVTCIDLHIVSVLLDAGAGPDWKYKETDQEGRLLWEGGRSEGLAVASWNMFVQGVFSASQTDPLRVDGVSNRLC